MMKLGANISDIHDKNRCIVIEAMLEYGKISRVDLSRITDLNKATITKIVKELLEAELAEEVGSIEASNGRKVAGVQLLMDDVGTIVVRIKKEGIQTAFCNMKGLIENYRIASYVDDTDIDIIVKQLIEEIQHQLDYGNEHDKKIMGISLATLGWLYQVEESCKIHADGFMVLGETDIKERMMQAFPQHQIVMDHDANMSALAEWMDFCKAEKRKPHSMLNIVGGIGFGSGIIINNELYRGFSGTAGEVGHMGINCLLQYKGMGKSGNYGGIFESYASPLSIRDYTRDTLWEYPDTVLNEKSSLKEIYQAYENDDPLASKAILRMVQYLAYGLTSLIFVLNPEVIVLGDEIINSGKFQKQLHRYLNQYLPEELASSLLIRFSTLDEMGVLTGAGVAMVKYYLKSFKMVKFMQE